MRRLSAVPLIVIATLAVGYAVLRPGASDPVAFASRLQAVKYDYEPVQSPAELAIRSDAIVVGTISEIVDSLSDGVLPGILIKMRAESVLRGQISVGQHIEVYVLRSPEFELELYQRTGVGLRTLVLLQTRQPNHEMGYTPFPQGMILAHGDGYIGGLDALNVMNESWRAPPTFNAFVTGIREAVGAEGTSIQ